MHGFAEASGGWESRLETWEREYLAGLLEQVAMLLAADGSGPPNGLQDAHGAGDSRSEPRLGESAQDRAVLAPPALAPVIDALLPDASEDPEVALEMAGLTRSPLRALKQERLEAVMAELLEPTGVGGAVRIARGHEQKWLGALNDVRLVLAKRLDIDGPEAAEEAHAIAWEEAPENEDEDALWRRGIALSYDMLTWWQESLVTVLLYG